MKNQYFGDVNDYIKYGLLRAIMSDGAGTLLIAWMLTPDDSSQHGRRRSYLEDSDNWKPYDPPLFEGLISLLRTEQHPSVTLIEGSDLLPRASYYSCVVPDTRRERNEWRGSLFSAAQNVDLIFLDPDNGIEVPSKPIGYKGSSKYVMWYEIKQLWDSGKSLMIYQHFPCQPRNTFIRRIAQELQSQTGTNFIEAFRTPNVLFLLTAQDHHIQKFRLNISLLAGRWREKITVVGLANNRF